MKSFKIMIVISIAIITIAGLIFFGMHWSNANNSAVTQVDECKVWYNELAERKAIAEQKNPNNSYMNNSELDKEISEYNIECGY